MRHDIFYLDALIRCYRSHYLYLKLIIQRYVNILHFYIGKGLNMKNITLPINCDTCHQPINRHDDAYVEWIDPNGYIDKVNIVHNKVSSPRGDCFQHTKHYNRCDLELTSILNEFPELRMELGLV